MKQVAYMQARPVHVLGQTAATQIIVRKPKGERDA